MKNMSKACFKASIKTRDRKNVTLYKNIRLVYNPYRFLGSITTIFQLQKLLKF